ncbi:MAG: hypothetical protein KatS3mg065_0880 [Chloroflexota bacterium]|nr:MAG: hypothetical protein KatS3mg065_0880 [Chloroflexota bacterium]
MSGLGSPDLRFDVAVDPCTRRASLAARMTDHVVRRLPWPTLATVWRAIALLLPVAVALAVPLSAVDLAYAVRAGRLILERGDVLRTDPFTFTAGGEAWIDQQWLAQVAFALVHDAAGWAGLALLRGALVGLIVLLLADTLRRSGLDARRTAILTLAAFVVVAPALALRAQLFAVVLFALTLRLLAVADMRPALRWLLVPITSLWANLHGTFVLLPAVVGVAWLSGRSGRAASRRSVAQRSRFAPLHRDPPCHPRQPLRPGGLGVRPRAGDEPHRRRPGDRMAADVGSDGPRRPLPRCPGRRGGPAPSRASPSGLADHRLARRPRRPRPPRRAGGRLVGPRCGRRRSARPSPARRHQPGSLGARPSTLPSSSASFSPASPPCHGGEPTRRVVRARSSPMRPSASRGSSPAASSPVAGPT